MAYLQGNSAITAIQNVALVTREDSLAVQVGAVIDGALLTADGVVQRGTLIYLQSSNQKWAPFVHGVSPALAVDQTLIVQDDIKVNALKDAFVTGYYEGFFRLSSLVDANPGLLVGDLPASFHIVPSSSDEVRVK